MCGFINSKSVLFLMLSFHFFIIVMELTFCGTNAQKGSFVIIIHIQSKFRES